MSKFIKSLADYLIEKVKSYPEIPRILYHGQPDDYSNNIRKSAVEFSKFNQSTKRFLKDGHVGFYFTPDKQEAFDYAEGGNVYVCNVILKNPYYFEHIFNYNSKGLIKNANLIDVSSKDKLLANGYDSVIILDFANTVGEVVVFDQNQIEILEIIKG